MRIAVIGGGVSGNLAARLLASHHDVVLYEANDYIGGHTNTVEVELDGRPYAVDTGFMVFNDRTYPNFIRMLDWLGLAGQDSDMSFSVRCDQTGLEYQGSSLNGLFAQRRNALWPSFYGMLADILRFNRQAPAVLESAGAEATLGEYLRANRYGPRFIHQYLVPMTAAIWSARPRQLFDFPVRFLVAFFQNHGLLQIRDRPQWQTIPGGSRNYAQRLVGPLGDRVRLRCPVQSISRHADHVVVRTAAGEAELFDEVVLASHADQSLRMLADPTPAERELLACFPYQRNEAVLHTDCSLLPMRRRAWASWNYHVTGREDEPARVTYDLSRLQRKDSPRPILLTLNHTVAIQPDHVLRRIEYHHPAYSLRAVAAQQRRAEISGRNRTHYCGAYWGYGFHEDGVNSALAVIRDFGLTWETCTAASTKEPSSTGAVAR